MSTADLIDLYPYCISQQDEVIFLLLKREPDFQYGGQWRMVGGKREHGETSWEAGLRELKEETGLTPAHYWTIPSLNHFYDPETDTIHQIPAFAAEIPEMSDPALDDEHCGFTWANLATVRDLVWWPEQVRLMKLIEHIISKDRLLDNWIIEIPT